MASRRVAERSERDTSRTLMTRAREPLHPPLGRRPGGEVPVPTCDDGFAQAHTTAARADHLTAVQWQDARARAPQVRARPHRLPVEGVFFCLFVLLFGLL